jgi:hypothetical protein
VDKIERGEGGEGGGGDNKKAGGLKYSKTRKENANHDENTRSKENKFVGYIEDDPNIR